MPPGLHVAVLQKKKPKTNQTHKGVLVFYRQAYVCIFPQMNTNQMSYCKITSGTSKTKTKNSNVSTICFSTHLYKRVVYIYLDLFLKQLGL